LNRRPIGVTIEVMLRMVVLLAAVAAAGCFKGPTAPDAVAGQPFELRAGSTAVLPNGARLTFERVTADSRCPIDAICVWAGDATVAVSLSRSGTVAQSSELHTQPTGSQISYSDYTISLTELTPYPRSSQKTPPGDYLATFVVNVR
jgi:hypothetical protein